MNDSDKIILFWDLFKGRSDVHGTYDPNKLNKQGEIKNNWKVAEPISSDTILDHIYGRAPLGVYPIRRNTKVKFSTVDLDTHNIPIVKKFIECSKRYRLHVYVEISRNEKYHAHIFFKNWILSWKIICILKHIQKEVGWNFEIFPKQNKVTGKGQGSFGNFINAPLFGKLAENGRTVFIDINNGWQPYSDQWALLKTIEKVDESTLNEIIENNGIEEDKEKTEFYQEDKLFTPEQVENIFKSCQAFRGMEDRAKNNHHLNHYERNLLVSVLYNLPPYGQERCLQLLKQCDDYDEEETQKRIKTATQNPWRCETIQGYGLCKETCQNIQTIKKKSPIAFAYPKGLKVESLKEIINDIRNRKIKAFKRKRLIAEEILKYLKSNGYFIWTDNHIPYYFLDSEKKLYQFDDTILVGLITDVSGINRSENEWEYLIEHLKVEAVRRGKVAEIHKFAFYNEKNKCLYVSKYDGQMYRLDGNEVKLLSNGNDGVLFWDDPKSSSYEYLGNDYHKGLVYKLLVEPINFAEGKEVKLSPGDQRYLWEIYLFTIFFESLLPTKVIVCIVGVRGGGKTSILNWVLLFLFGSNFQTISLAKGKEDAFLATVTNSYFAAFDNVDGKIEWLNDHLAAVATGAGIKLRKLYTTNEEVEYTPKVFIALTSRTPQFKRDDVVDRLLLLRVDRIKNFKSEKALREELLIKRNALWTETLNELNRIVKVLKDDNRPFTSTFRMADWAELAWRIADSRGEGDRLLDILKRMETEQSSFLLEGDPLYEALLTWLEDKNNQGRGVTAKELYDELSVILDKMKIVWWIKSPRSLAQRLKNLKNDLEVFFNIEIGDGSGGKNTYAFSPKSDTTDTTRKQLGNN